MLELKDLAGMTARTLQSPREGASEVLSLGIPRDAVGLIVVLVVVLSVLLAQVMALLVFPTSGDPTVGVFGNAIVAGVVQMGAMVGTIAAVYWIGRAMGGTGSLIETAILISWLQFIMVCLQFVQIVVLLLLPPLASLVSLLALGLFLWLLTSFVATLHGFQSLLQVFVMIVVSAFTIAFIVSVFMALFGVDIPLPEAGA